MGLDAGDTIICPWNLLKRRQVDGDDTVEELLQPVLRNGDRVTPAPSLDAIRERVRSQLRLAAPDHPTAAKPARVSGRAGGTGP